MKEENVLLKEGIKNLSLAPITDPEELQSLQKENEEKAIEIERLN
jgi:hypothetical protein